MRATPLTTGGMGRWSAMHWPWLLVAAAWATALAAAASGWNSLLNHHELIEHSRLP